MSWSCTVVRVGFGDMLMTVGNPMTHSPPPPLPHPTCPRSVPLQTLTCWELPHSAWLARTHSTLWHASSHNTLSLCRSLPRSLPPPLLPFILMSPCCHLIAPLEPVPGRQVGTHTFFFLHFSFHAPLLFCSSDVWKLTEAI